MEPDIRDAGISLGDGGASSPSPEASSKTEADASPSVPDTAAPAISVVPERRVAWLRAAGRRGSAFLDRSFTQFADFIGYTHFRRPTVKSATDGGAPPRPTSTAVESGERPGAASSPTQGVEATLAIVNAAIAATPPKGQVLLPSDMAALANLLSDPPTGGDLEVLDALGACFGKDPSQASNRLLLAVARNLSRTFGRQGRLPMACRQAWQMLDPVLFIEEFAGQLAAICNFVLGWQADNAEFLILEFAETQLIQHLFESQHPRQHGALLVKVMQFKALSGQRMGIIRRIPARVELAIRGLERPAAIDYVRDSLLLLDHLARPDGFPPIVAEATAAHAKLTALATARFAPQPQLRMAEPGQPQAPAAAPAPVSAPAPQAAPAPAPAAPPPPQQVMVAPQPAPQQVAPAPQPVAVIQQVAPAPPPLPTPQMAVVVSGNRRLSQNQKTEAVLRVLRGEPLEVVAASVGTRPQVLAQWQSKFLEAGASALVRRRKNDPSVEQLKAKVTDLLAAIGELGIEVVQPAPYRPLALPAPSSSDAPGRSRRKRRIA